ncbi:uncharacterized protein LOC142484851 [Ascaphus truei]|uniref:uncharacterized protein LOC142484851 n=1 Tax=Ascaphus truei TaxID=8439 RepID=UPI003F597D82
MGPRSGRFCTWNLAQIVERCVGYGFTTDSRSKSQLEEDLEEYEDRVAPPADSTQPGAQDVSDRLEEGGVGPRGADGSVAVATGLATSGLIALLTAWGEVLSYEQRLELLSTALGRPPHSHLVSGEQDVPRVTAVEAAEPANEYVTSRALVSNAAVPREAAIPARGDQSAPQQTPKHTMGRNTPYTGEFKLERRCYHCHKVGHIRPHCPDRERSEGPHQGQRSQAAGPETQIGLAHTEEQSTVMEPQPRGMSQADAAFVTSEPAAVSRGCPSASVEMQPADVLSRHPRRVTFGDRQAESLPDLGAAVILVQPEDLLPGTGMQRTMPDGGLRSLQGAQIILDGGANHGMREVGVLSRETAEVRLSNNLEPVICVVAAELPAVAAIPKSLSSGVTAESTSVPLHLGPTVPVASAETRQVSQTTESRPVTDLLFPLPVPVTPDLETKGGWLELGTADRDAVKADPSLEGMGLRASESWESGGSDHRLWHHGLWGREPGSTGLSRGWTGRRRLVGPREGRQQVLQVAFPSPLVGHQGVTHMRTQLLQPYFWPEAAGAVADFGHPWDACQPEGKASDYVQMLLNLLPGMGNMFQEVAQVVPSLLAFQALKTARNLAAPDYAKKFLEQTDASDLCLFECPLMSADVTSPRHSRRFQEMNGGTDGADSEYLRNPVSIDWYAP